MSSPSLVATYTNATLKTAAMLLLLALPWLNPFTLGPTASVAPLLVSWTCAAALLLTRQRSHAHHSIPLPVIGLVLLMAAAALWPASAPPGAEALALAWLLAGLASVRMDWLQYVGVAEALAPWVSPANLGEAFGNLRQRNLDASLTSMALCALLWQWAERFSEARFKREFSALVEAAWARWKDDPQTLEQNMLGSGS